MKTSFIKTAFKKTLIPALSLALASSLFFSCDHREEQLAKENAMLSMTLEEQDSVLSEYRSDFDEIESNFAEIRATEARVREWADGEERMGDSRDRMIRDMGVINELLAENRETIQSLEARIKRNGGENSQLKTRIAELKSSTTEQAREILALRDMVDAKNNQIESLEEELMIGNLKIKMKDSLIAGQEDRIENQDLELLRADVAMNTVYFTTGSYKELKDKGVLEKEGTFLGLGGDKQLTDDPSPSAFTIMDKREHDAIPVYAKKAELVTPHPKDAYSLEKNEEGEISFIKIEDPEAFWQHSQYLVVAVR